MVGGCLARLRWQCFTFEGPRLPSFEGAFVLLFIHLGVGSSVYV